jgi:hypothetical protein
MLCFFPRRVEIMDVLKLCKKVLENEDVKEIPLLYVLIVVGCVIDAIGSGECFYNTEFD